MYEEASNRMATCLRECKEDYQKAFNRLIEQSHEVAKHAEYLESNGYPDYDYKTVILSDGSEDGTEQYLSRLIQELKLAESNMHT